MSMKYVRDQTGRLPERPHYEPKELDTLFENIVSKFLKLRHGIIEFPIATDDLTVLIERDTKDLDIYADLTSYGPNVEGVTEFHPGQKPTVRISRTVSEAENSENRFRTTLTHEYGHVHLHGYLFEMNTRGSDLLDQHSKPNVIACKRDTIISAPRTDWMEWQAGYACGAMLMPASYVRSEIERYRVESKLYGPVPASTPQGLNMIDLIVNRFQVSRDAARVRLSVLGYLGAAPTAGSLPF
ncbi:MAG: ImmA/IrrE family metallo-endopeptidase [Alphaproteobacteria bacterium]|nr:ImmA/IrrE family metallo-endopeptidase [Alphaproteobacteria bacterium]